MTARQFVLDKLEVCAELLDGVLLGEYGEGERRRQEAEPEHDGWTKEELSWFRTTAQNCATPS